MVSLEARPKSAAYPDGGRNTGIYSSKLGPGGNSLINSFHSQGPVGDFEGLLVMTWDAREKHIKPTSSAMASPALSSRPANLKAMPSFFVRSSQQAAPR
jgi:hypothetical protein